MWPLVATTTGPEVAPSGTRATRKASELTTTDPSTSPNCTFGRRNSGGRRPEPVIRISPPMSAKAGATASMRGPPLTFLLPRRRSENAIVSTEYRAPGGEHESQRFLLGTRYRRVGTTLVDQSTEEVASPRTRRFLPQHHPARFRFLLEGAPTGAPEVA